MTDRAGAPRAPLGEELRIAATALERLAEGASLPAALEAAMRDPARASRPGAGPAPKLGPGPARSLGELPSASRAAIRDIASRTVRAWGLCRALSERLNQRPPAPAMLALQQVVLAQLLDPVRPDATTVDQAVGLHLARLRHLRAVDGWLAELEAEHGPVEPETVEWAARIVDDWASSGGVAAAKAG